MMSNRSLHKRVPDRYEARPPTFRRGDKRRGPGHTWSNQTRRCAWPSSSRTMSACPDRVSEPNRSEEHTSELQSRQYLVCRLLLEKKKKRVYPDIPCFRRAFII